MANRRMAIDVAVSASLYAAEREEARRARNSRYYAARVRVRSADAIALAPIAWRRGYATLARMIGRGGIVRPVRVTRDERGRERTYPLRAQHRAACSALQSQLDARPSTVAGVMRANAPAGIDASADASRAMVAAGATIAESITATLSVDARVPRGTLFVSGLSSLDVRDGASIVGWIEAYIGAGEAPGTVAVSGIICRSSWLDRDGIERCGTMLPTAVGNIGLDRMIGEIADRASASLGCATPSQVVSALRYWIADGTRKGADVFIPARDEIAASRSRGERADDTVATDPRNPLARVDSDSEREARAEFWSRVNDSRRAASAERRKTGAAALVRAGYIASPACKPGEESARYERVARIPTILARDGEADRASATAKREHTNAVETFARDARVSAANWLASLALYGWR